MTRDVACPGSRLRISRRAAQAETAAFRPVQTDRVFVRGVGVSGLERDRHCIVPTGIVDARTHRHQQAPLSFTDLSSGVERDPAPSEDQHRSHRGERHGEQRHHRPDHRGRAGGCFHPHHSSGGQREEDAGAQERKTEQSDAPAALPQLYASGARSRNPLILARLLCTPGFRLAVHEAHRGRTAGVVQDEDETIDRLDRFLGRRFQKYL